MFHPTAYSGTREENYALVIEQLKALIAGEPNMIANLANAAALLNQFLTDINWVGFYLAEGDELVLGPFQGLPACVRIPFGKGVCGTAAAERRTVVVPDVHQFPGHIACDAASQSEIVVPLIKEGRVIGVLDIDSPVKNRFDDTDRRYLEQFAGVLISE
ncbi:histidine kinase [Geobacillus subterraneus]|uniref:Histidine kinase n=2 Tax=Geobacillus TaxID=129337 RepID=A0ABM6A8K5_9BACL|nr:MULTISPECIES: GAF domain-containing protein [Geobacillus]AMX82588.1 histidine kinase [Geobacillus subterraneus]KZS26331.1 histidine kinase [Geobacillus subterraneus]OXB90677.1 histidine kinase [Geobacillus uzenensis]QIZ68689.1 GAF domain-containing protein [Geobacillus subterraneus]WPZ17713.1 GAF domain-containing protein [Geobacillus subterraneus]